MDDDRWISEIRPKDRSIGATASDLPSLNRVLKQIENTKAKTMIDLGCGYGGLTTYVAKYLNIDNVYGVDLDDERLSYARSRCVKTYKLDLNRDRLPFPDGFFDLVVSFGALEHLVYFDNFFSESFRVLTKDGHIIIAMPNLGSYVNRIALLLGYQPRDVEISFKFPPGILPFHARGFVGHIHSATLGAVKQMLKHYGFNITKVGSLSPYHSNKLVRAADKTFSLSPSLSRRFIILSKKP
jgi:ubiquinone/menaquinone biosynthesis C-methylase UbiE